MMFPLVFLLILALIARRFLAERSEPRAARLPDPEVARLRDEVDGLSAQVRRLTEEQSFMLGLLADGRTPAALAAPAEEVPPLNERPDTEMPDGHA